MKPSPYQISAFTQVAREKSFSNAAYRLGVTQSSVTQHVAKLEKIMGAQLFVRRRDGLQLTKAGSELFRITDRMATLEQLANEKILDYGALSDGHLRIIATSPRPAMEIIARYNALHPQVQLDFTLFSWTAATKLLKERQVDIAIMAEPETSDGLFTRELRQTRFVVLLRRDHRLAERKMLSFQDLQSETLILPEDGSLTQRMIKDKLDATGQTFSRIIRTTTFPVVKEAVLHGAGVGILLEDSLYPSSNLVARPIREMPETYRDCIAIPAEKTDLRLIKSFLDVASVEPHPVS